MKKALLFLFSLLLLLSFTAWPAFSGGASEEEEEKTGSTTGRGSEWKEAPMLHEKVLAGELPPLEERLPKNPYVQEVIDDIGYYGGTMRRAWTGPSDRWGPAKLDEEFLIKFGLDGNTIEPNLAESYEVLENGRVYVFHLREGLKWSDGDGFDADDIMFHWEHIILKEIIQPINECFSINDKLCTVEKVDQLTVKVIFPEPSPMFLQNLIFQVREFYSPSHYAKTILPEFIGEDTTLKMAQDAGYSDIQNFLRDRLYYFWIRNDIPMMRAWVPVNDNSEQRWIMQRNPYYWKVDPEGNQLPYIDEIVHEFVEDRTIVNLKAIAGDLDMQLRHLNVADYTLLMESQEQGGYKVFTMIDPMGSVRTLFPNLYAKDLVLREIFRDVRFRRAVSVALDREEINEIAYNGLHTPRQASLAPGIVYYSKEWEEAYTQYDPDLANRLLDEMGLKWDAEKKYRLRPDGKVLEILIQHSFDFADDIILAAKNLEAIGIKAIIKRAERSLFEEIRDNNDLQISIWGFEGFNFLIDHSSLIPLTLENWWAGQAGSWVETEGEDGEAPYGDLAKVISNYQKIQSTMDAGVRDSLAKEIVALHANNLWAIGIAGLPKTIGVINTKMRNVALNRLSCDALRHVGALWPWQMYYDQ